MIGNIIMSSQSLGIVLYGDNFRWKILEPLVFSKLALVSPLYKSNAQSWSDLLCSLGFYPWENYFGSIKLGPHHDRCFVEQGIFQKKNPSLAMYLFHKKLPLKLAHNFKCISRQKKFENSLSAFLTRTATFFSFYQCSRVRGKSLLESWCTTFPRNWLLTLICVQFISNF